MEKWNEKMKTSWPCRVGRKAVSRASDYRWEVSTVYFGRNIFHGNRSSLLFWHVVAIVHALVDFCVYIRLFGRTIEAQSVLKHIKIF